MVQWVVVGREEGKGGRGVGGSWRDGREGGKGQVGEERGEGRVGRVSAGVLLFSSRSFLFGWVGRKEGRKWRMGRKGKEHYETD